MLNTIRSNNMKTFGNEESVNDVDEDSFGKMIQMESEWRVI